MICVVMIKCELKGGLQDLVHPKQLRHLLCLRKGKGKSCSADEAEILGETGHWNVHLEGRGDTVKVTSKVGV